MKSRVKNLKVLKTLNERDNMKFFIGIALLLFIASCTAPLTNRIEKCVNDVETNHEEWSQEDWNISQEEYKKLLKEYNENYDSYTQEEKAAIDRAIGRYNGMILKRGIEEFENTIEEFGKRLPSLIEGFGSAFEDNDSK